jgi:hypothetical protein
VHSSKIIMSVGREDVLIVNSTDAIPKNLQPLLEISLSPKLTCGRQSKAIPLEDNSYFPNLSLSGESWKAPFRPAIILSRKVNEGGCYSFWLIPLTKLTPVDALSLKEFGADYLTGSLSNLSA